MNPRLRITVAAAAGAAFIVACSPAEFSSDKTQEKSDGLSLLNPDVPDLDDAGRDLPSPGAPDARAGRCDYPLYTGPYNTPAQSECHTNAYSYAAPAGQSTAGGKTIRFRMYNASNLSHGLVPSPHRAIATQKISLSALLPAGSVDLVLGSYEPVIWKIVGNTAAVRSVHVSGYHCAKVEGVAADRVRIDTYEQGVIEPAGALPLSSNTVFEQTVYEGSCLADNTLLIQ